MIRLNKIYITIIFIFSLIPLIFWTVSAHAEFWSTDYFLKQTKLNQASYITGLIDMYEYTRDEIAPDPDDWVKPCLLNFSSEELRQEFVNWLFEDPASWRLSPATLLLEALEDFCNN